jgi:hypothetical protein
VFEVVRNPWCKFTSRMAVLHDFQVSESLRVSPKITHENIQNARKCFEDVIIAQEGTHVNKCLEGGWRCISNARVLIDDGMVE